VGLIIASAALGCASLCWGYGIHRMRTVPALLAAGLGLLALGRVAEHGASIAEAWQW